MSSPGSRIPKLVIEGVVIVSSILIAFAVDAWWNEREDSQEFQRSVAALVVELQDNVRKIEEFRVFDEQEVENTELALAAIDGDTILTEWAQRWSAVGSGMNYGPFTPITSAIEASQQTGAWQRLPLNVQVEISRYLSDFRDLLDQGQYGAAGTIRLVERLDVYGGFRSFIPSEFREEEGLTTREPDGDWEGVLSDPAFEGAVFTNRILFLNDLGGLSKWRPRLEAIIAQLEEMVDDEIFASLRAAAADAS